MHAREGPKLASPLPSWSCLVESWSSLWVYMYLCCDSFHRISSSSGRSCCTSLELCVMLTLNIYSSVSGLGETTELGHNWTNSILWLGCTVSFVAESPCQRFLKVSSVTKDIDAPVSTSLPFKCTLMWNNPYALQSSFPFRSAVMTLAYSFLRASFFLQTLYRCPFLPQKWWS